MNETKRTQKFLLSKRAKIIKFLVTEGYTGAQIGRIFNIDRSMISRILQDEKKYKGLVRSILQD